MTLDDYQAIFRAYRQGLIALGTAARDLTIRCEGQLVRLNRTLFKCLSPLLIARMGASVQRDKPSQEVVLSGVPFATLQLFCDYLHGVPIGVPQDVDELGALIHLVELSHRNVLNMPDIAAGCDTARSSITAVVDRPRLLSIAEHALSLSPASSSTGPVSERERYLKEKVTPAELCQLFIALVKEDPQSKYRQLLFICIRSLAQHFYAEHLSAEQALLVWQLSRSDQELRSAIDYETITFVQDIGTEHEHDTVLPRLPCLIFCERLRSLVASSHHVVIGKDFGADQLEWIHIAMAEASEQDPVEHLSQASLCLEAANEEVLLAQEIISPHSLHRLLKLAIQQKSEVLLNRCIESINALYRKIVHIERRPDNSLCLSVKNEDKMDEPLKAMLIALKPRIQEAAIHRWPTQSNRFRKGLSRIPRAFTNKTCVILGGLLVVNSLFTFLSHVSGDDRSIFTYMRDEVTESGSRFYTNITELNVEDGAWQAASLAYWIFIGIIAKTVVDRCAARLTVGFGISDNHYDFLRKFTYNGLGLSQPLDLSTQLVQQTPRLTAVQEANFEPALWSVQQLPSTLRSLDISVCREQLTNDAIAIIVHRFPELESLTIAGPCPSVDAYGWAHLASLTRLKRLHVTLNPGDDPFKGVLQDLNLSTLAPFWPDFKQIEVEIEIKNTMSKGEVSISMEECRFLRAIPEWLEVILRYSGSGMILPVKPAQALWWCPNVTRLLPHVACTRLLETNVGRRLRTLCLDQDTSSNAVPPILALHCPRLEDLRLIGMQFTSEQLRRIGQHGLNLRHLQFRGCSDITHDELKSLASLPQLKTLEIIGSNLPISDDGIAAFKDERERLGLSPLESFVCLGAQQMSKSIVRRMHRAAIPHQEHYLNSLKLPTLDLSLARDNPQQFFSRMDFYIRNAGYFLELYADNAESVSSTQWIEQSLRSIRASFDLPLVARPRMNSRDLFAYDPSTHHPLLAAKLENLIRRIDHENVLSKLHIPLLMMRQWLQSGEVERIDEVVRGYLQAYSQISPEQIAHTAALCAERMNGGWLLSRIESVLPDPICYLERENDPLAGLMPPSDLWPRCVEQITKKADELGLQGDERTRFIALTLLQIGRGMLQTVGPRLLDMFYQPFPLKNKGWLAPDMPPGLFCSSFVACSYEFVTIQPICQSSLSQPLFFSGNG